MGKPHPLTNFHLPSPNTSISQVYQINMSGRGKGFGGLGASSSSKKRRVDDEAISVHDSDSEYESKNEAIGTKKHTMMFIFAMHDAESKAYISDDPIFGDVKGYQPGFSSFVTEKIYKYMKEKIVENDPESKDSMDHYKYDVSDYEVMANVLYGFTECMEEAATGSTCDAVLMVQYMF